MTINCNDTSVILYIRHICIEVFQKEFNDSEDEISVHVTTNDSDVLVTTTLKSITSTIREENAHHPSPSVAKTCAIGKTVIKIAEKLGFKKSPYGVLTGVRPVKIALLYAEKSDFASIFKERYLVDESKAKLLEHCTRYHVTAKEITDKNDVSLYVSIPFCPSRCNYCSFVSYGIERLHHLIPEYINTLCQEIQEVSNLVQEFSLRVKSIYVGGGTPGVLSCEQISKLLEKINFSFDTSSLFEFTYEIGRPETVTQEKLQTLKNLGVTRVSINTQTTNDEVLSLIGRRHTSDEYFNAVDMAQKIGFHSINTDLIAGLSSDSLSSFKKSVIDVINTGVDNISIHTLCLKKSADIKTADFDRNEHFDIDDFLNFSHSTCISEGFLPYYLYRQKYALGNHESTGWCKDDKFSYYNISMMNEIGNVIGVGAGATSRISLMDKNAHFANFKYPYDYISDKTKFAKEISMMNNVFKTMKE